MANAIRSFIGGTFIIFGNLLLAAAVLMSTSAAGSMFVNVSLIHFNLSLQVWGFGLILVGMLMRRPAKPD